MRDRIGYDKQQTCYCTWSHDGIRFYKNIGSTDQFVLFIRVFIAVIYLSEEINRRVLAFLDINIVWPFLNFIGIFASHVSIPSYVDLYF